MESINQVQKHSHNNIDGTPKLNYANLTNKIRYVLFRALTPATSTSVVLAGGNLVMPYNGNLTSLGATVDTAGTTGTMTVDVLKNGTSVLVSGAIINIASGATTSATNNIQPKISYPSFSAGDVFTFNITAVASTPALGLTIFLNTTEN